MPKTIKKKSFKIIDANTLWEALNDLVGETVEFTKKSIDQCIQDEHTVGSASLESLTRNYYWSGAHDILKILCVRTGIFDKKQAKAILKRNKEMR